MSKSAKQQSTPAVAGRWPVKKPYKKLYKYIRPARWIQHVWDEAQINAAGRD
jgi:hypothetical protein